MRRQGWRPPSSQATESRAPGRWPAPQASGRCTRGFCPRINWRACRRCASPAGRSCSWETGSTTRRCWPGRMGGPPCGSGADAAIEAADVVFMTSKVTAVPEAVSIARKTAGSPCRPWVFALTVKALVMALGFLGMANMWMAVFAGHGRGHALRAELHPGPAREEFTKVLSFPDCPSNS